MSSRWLLIATGVLIVAMVSCGDDDAAVTTTSAPATTSAPTTTPGEPPTTTAAPTTSTSATTTTVVTTTAAPTTTLAPTTTTVAPTTTTTTLPGEPFDIFPPEGAVLGVIGVAHDDVLNVRELPGLTRILTTLDPLADDVISAGAGWKLPTTIWWKVVAAGETGWVNSRFVAYLGSVDDMTSQVVADLGGIPTAPTMAELGMIVAESMAYDDPPSRIVMTVAPTTGDLGEVTYDVIGLGDDATTGLRLHVFGAPNGDFSLKSVEVTSLCDRGLSDGLCV